MAFLNNFDICVALCVLTALVSVKGMISVLEKPPHGKQKSNLT